jgi:predicted nucleotidyltransferase component of viral defense system
MLDIGRHRFILVQILKDIYSNCEINTQLGFKGGTACYLFYGLPRFSVDLDFTLLNEVKREEVFLHTGKILSDYGDLKDAKAKRQTLFFLLFYEEHSTNIKVEVSLRTYPDRFEVRNYLGIPMQVMIKEDIMAHKLVAFLDRHTVANRDLFDLWYFFKNNWDINREIVEMRTGKTLELYLKKCIERLRSINTTYILQGLGEVLDEKQKQWVKNNLKKDLLFLMRSYLE